jgi:GT2 family glycosyltransferase
MTRDPSVATITVALNGANVLAEHLGALLSQSRPVQEIVVVDNGSTDRTLDILRQRFPRVTLLPMTENLGVGAGFSTGLEYARQNGHDWFWLFDQDSTPVPGALEVLMKALGTIDDFMDKVGILACLPVEPDSGFEYSGLLWRDRLVPVPPDLARQPVYFVDSVISSGSLIRREVVEKTGLPRQDFFIDYVDHEYNLRIRRAGFKIAVVRDSVMYHRIGHPRPIRRFIVSPHVKPAPNAPSRTRCPV